MENTEIQNCDFPFNYYGKSRSECILDKKTGKKWCATKKDANNKVIKKGWCIPNKISKKKKKTNTKKEEMENTEIQNCDFPFNYYGKSRSECILDKKTGKKWCATKKDANNKVIKKGWCIPNKISPTVKKSRKKAVEKKINSNKKFNILLKNEKEQLKLKTYWDSNIYNNLFGIVYLYNKHKNIMCKPIGKIFNHKSDSFTKFKFSSSLNLYPADFQISFIPDFNSVGSYSFMTSVKERKRVLSRFELFFSKPEKDFFIDLYKCKTDSKRFYIAELYIDWGSSAHANMLVFDLKNNTCERFEPYGLQYSRTSERNQFANVFSTLVSQLFDKKINVILKRNKIKYIPPNKYCPDKSFQIYNNLYNNDNRNNKDPGGYCGAWSLWWADLRLSNPDIPYKNLIQLALNQIKTSDIGFTEFIRKYSIFLTNNRISLFKELKVSIKDRNKMLNVPKRHSQLVKQTKYYNAFLAKYLSKIIN